MQGQPHIRFEHYLKVKLRHALGLSSESPALGHSNVRDRPCVFRKYCRVIRYVAFQGGAAGKDLLYKRSDKEVGFRRSDAFHSQISPDLLIYFAF